MRNKEDRGKLDEKQRRDSYFVLWLQINSKPWMSLQNEAANVGLVSINMKSALNFNNQTSVIHSQSFCLTYICPNQ